MAALTILMLLRGYRRRRGNQTAAARQRGSYPDEKGTQWGWAPKLNPQRGIQNVKGSMSSRRTFGLGEYGDVPASPQSSLQRGVSMLSTDRMTMSPMSPTAGPITNGSGTPFDNVSEVEGGEALFRGVPVSTGGGPSTNTTNSVHLITSEGYPTQRVPSLVTTPVDYSPISGYLGTVPEGRMMNARSEPGHRPRSLSTSTLQHSYPGSVSRSQSLPYGRAISSTPVLYHCDINSAPTRNASASRSSRRQVSSTGHGEDPFITPPLSPASPSVQLAERQSSTRSSGTKQGRSRSSSVDQRLDPGVLRATRKHQRRENSLNSGRIETPSGPLSAEEGDAVDERERYLDVNGEDSDCGSSVDLSTGDQSAL